MNSSTVRAFINCALLAKIHTVEWTPGLLACDELDIAMKANWWGMKREKRDFYRVVVANVVKVMGVLSPSRKDDMDEAHDGILETDPDHHAAPYAMTEEFASMYRLHGLIPDDFELRRSEDDGLLEEKNLFEISGSRTRETLESHSNRDLLYSFGVAYPGALRLHNYPRFLQNLKRENGDRFDLAAVDVLRDRERGVPRYNEFRELMFMPGVQSFEELTR